MRTLYRARSVHTLGERAAGEWILIDERHVERVGRGEAPHADRVVELPGATLLPGFIDTHVHLTGTGLSAEGPPLERAGSSDELLAMVREELHHHSRRLLAHGYDESHWDNPQLPTLEELDALGDVPVILVRADGHVCLANSRALNESAAAGESGVELDATGRPSGIVRREANQRLQRWFHETLSEHEIREFQLQAAALAASRGVTCVHEMSMPALRGRRDLETLLDHRDQLPVDVVIYAADRDIPYVIDLGLGTIGGDLPLDGSIGARTAALTEPYADGSDNGALYEDDDELAEFFHNAHLAGLQVGVHAIGDAAIEQALRIWERVYRALDSRERRHFRARRHRIEHFEMPAPDHLERAAVLGLAISVQPAFDAAWGYPGGMYEGRLGVARARTMNPFAEILDRGIAIGAGSDSPITALDPMHGIWALENHHDESQRLDRIWALRFFTTGGAALAQVEDKKGRLGPGMHADFAAYDVDPTTTEDPRGVRPILTVSRGREVYVRGG